MKALILAETEPTLEDEFAALLTKDEEDELGLATETADEDELVAALLDDELASLLLVAIADD